MERRQLPNAHVGSQGVFLEEEVTTIEFSFRIWQHIWSLVCPECNTNYFRSENTLLWYC